MKINEKYAKEKLIFKENVKVKSSEWKNKNK